MKLLVLSSFAFAAQAFGDWEEEQPMFSMRPGLEKPHVETPTPPPTPYPTIAWTPFKHDSNDCWCLSCGESSMTTYSTSDKTCGLPTDKCNPKPETLGRFGCYAAGGTGAGSCDCDDRDCDDHKTPAKGTWVSSPIGPNAGSWFPSDGDCNVGTNLKEYSNVNDEDACKKKCVEYAVKYGNGVECTFISWMDTKDADGSKCNLKKNCEIGTDPVKQDRHCWGFSWGCDAAWTYAARDLSHPWLLYADSFR